MKNSWLSTPLARVGASAVSWFLFTMFFSLLFQVSLMVIGLGGFCASGGAYEIAVECPDSVVAFAPFSIFGGLAAVGIGLFFSGGFGTQLGAWAWAILFIGLSVPFALGGGVTNWLLCAMFVVMGAVPLFLELRANIARTFIGPRSAGGEAFAFTHVERRSLMSMSAPREGSVVPHVGHVVLGLGVPLVFGALGVFTAIAWFRA